MKIRKPVLLALTALAVLAAAGQAPAATNLAVFNFQLKTGQEDWVWLEKFMSDQLATDLVQDRSLSVVARDRMQLMAQQMKWVPEFATTDAKVMGGIRSQLEIEYLITGVCSITGGTLEITAQIVEVGSRKEVHRKTVTGKTDQVIDLQKQLSADAMSWFTKRPAGEILKTLPMWTRSIPAVRALYEGMHLYDQGRYAEGWVKFRQSSQEDKNYVEAVYWVGKMYYFMYRYEHARRTLEKFVYLNCLHPRMGDAIAEYAHTFESSGASPQELLAFYRAVNDRFPKIVIGPTSTYFPISGVQWAMERQATILSAIRQDRQLAVMDAPEDLENGPFGRARLSSMLRHHALTGEVLPDNVIKKLTHAGLTDPVLHFAPGELRRELRSGRPEKIYGQATTSRDKEAIFCNDFYDVTFILLAPSGYIFKSLRFEPIAQGDDAVLTGSLRSLGAEEDIDPNVMALDKARARGVVFLPPPRLGMLLGRCVFRSKDAESGCVAVQGVNVSATLEKLGQHGAVEVNCADTDDFRVDIDGVFGRWSYGVVGLLTPGRHTVTISPVFKHSPLGKWTGTVDVRAGEITRVVGSLPWKDPRPVAPVTTSRLFPDKDGIDRFLWAWLSGPAVQVDDEAIRLIWPYQGDLWSSSSTDGKSFSEPRILSLPVSTAWAEGNPRLFRDESGRFVLTFLSDRDGQHRTLAYFCRSRDLVHWSEPSLISDMSSTNHDVIQDSLGRYICALANTPNNWTTVTLLASVDGYQWTKLPGKPIAFNLAPIRIRGRSDGAIELYAVPTLPGTRFPSGRYDLYKLRAKPAYKQLVRFVHNGQEWSPKEVLSDFSYDEQPDWISLTHDAHGPVVLATDAALNRGRGHYGIVRQVDGNWVSSGSLSGFARERGEIAYHPRWGYVMGHGPFVTRCPKLPSLLADAAKEMPKPTITEPRRIDGGRWSIQRGMEKTVGIRFSPAGGTPGPSSMPSRRPAEPGELSYVIPGNWSYYESIIFRGAERFLKPRAGSGTVNPDAVVVTTIHNGSPICVALDSLDPSAVHYDVLRIDLTGKGDFHNAIVVPRVRMWGKVSSKEYKTEFESQPACPTTGGRVVPGRMNATYIDGADLSFEICMRVEAEGMCSFGNKLYKVGVYDNNNNLRLGDAAWPGNTKGCDSVVVYLDKGAEVYGRYGQPVKVDGKMYDLRVSADGNSITAMDYAGPAGLLKIDHVSWSAWLRKGDDRFSIAGGTDPVPVPPGKYVLSDYIEYSSADAQEARHRLNCQGAVDVTIASGGTTTLAVGSPLRGTLAVDVSGRTIKFHYSEQDSAGLRPGIEPPSQKTLNRTRSVKIVDSQNKAVFSFTMDVDSKLDGWNGQWQPGDGVSGTFTATAEQDTGPLTTTPATATFTVK